MWGGGSSVCPTATGRAEPLAFGRAFQVCHHFLSDCSVHVSLDLYVHMKLLGTSNWIWRVPEALRGVTRLGSMTSWQPLPVDCNLSAGPCTTYLKVCHLLNSRCKQDMQAIKETSAAETFAAAACIRILLDPTTTISVRNPYYYY
jgi:hypothetical protein